MADICEILWLYDDYSLATSPYHIETIQAFSGNYPPQCSMTNPWILCSYYVLWLSYFSVGFRTFSFKTPPDPCKIQHVFLVIYIIIQVFIRTYPESFYSIAYSFRTYSALFPTKKHKQGPTLFRAFSNKGTQSNPTKTPFCVYRNIVSVFSLLNCFVPLLEKARNKVGPCFVFLCWKKCGIGAEWVCNRIERFQG